MAEACYCSSRKINFLNVISLVSQKSPTYKDTEVVVFGKKEEFSILRDEYQAVFSKESLAQIDVWLHDDLNESSL
jgi:hypothetical protein